LFFENFEIKKKIFLSFKLILKERVPHTTAVQDCVYNLREHRGVYNGYIRIPVHNRDFQGFSDFPIFGLFAGHKTAAMLRHSRVPPVDLYFY
jgi:hypothetical protein